MKRFLKTKEDLNAVLFEVILENESLDEAFHNLLQAKAICIDQNINDLKPTIDYNISCCHSLKGELEQAAKFLHDCIDIPELKEQAKIDGQLENLRNDSMYQYLFE